MTAIGAGHTEPIVAMEEENAVNRSPTKTGGSGCPFTIGFDKPDDGADSYARYAQLRTTSPLAEAVISLGAEADAGDATGMFGQPLFLAVGYDAAVAALSDRNLSVDRRSLPDPARQAALPPIPAPFVPLLRTLLTTDPPDHTRLGRLVQPSFTPTALGAFRPRVQEIVDGLIDDALRAAGARGEREPDRRLEMVDAVAYPLPMMVVCELMGVPDAERPMVRGWAEPLAGQGTNLEAVEREITEFSAHLRDLFARKRANPGDDLTSALVRAEEDGEKLDDQELLSMVYILIIAGHATTVHLIGNGVLTLLSHPDQLARFRADPELGKNAVEEILRFWGPVELPPPRFARDATVLEGAHLEPGATVAVGLAAANRDPARFAVPDTFDIGRADANRHLAFGRGVHQCLGAPLARIEGQVAMEKIFRRLPHLRLEPPGQQPVVHQGLFRGPDGLWVRC